ncbi:hypothetical protein GUITHDRAFT_102621 [Guillardia theta CCMP2712]|uniref:Methyltransferase domain-containing protein n=1 Tax=Guillardia theta (strain CCMP2712) TaxID=905079 RepID=L1JTW4_GUITC|nr:hypothetical protein GUITHDRAFT_102621 [Guillardia theta CCMP2712]EKX52006.1 hypothetical protein GUITHDRAFT_102621 [Guillardia theta CCMP2712]|eukprot:XP_005838986.1 hypothetical protein GUITHDRAFT_102621 [Guillardia theta CCMP2712]
MPYNIDSSAMAFHKFRPPQLWQRRNFTTSRAPPEASKAQKDEDVFDSVSLRVDNTKSLNIGFVEKSTIAKKEITRIEMIGHPRDLITSLTDSRKAAEKQLTDLTGLSLWSVTFTLGTLLLENKRILKGKNVLELGCGTGMLGLSAAACRAKSVGIDSNRYLDIEGGAGFVDRQVLAGCDVETRHLELKLDSNQDAATNTFDVILGSELIHFGLDRRHKLNTDEGENLTSSRFDAIFSTASQYLCVSKVTGMQHSTLVDRSESGFILLSFKINPNYIHTISGPQFPTGWNYRQGYIDEVTGSGKRYGLSAVKLIPLSVLFNEDREELMGKKNLKDFLCVVAARSQKALSSALHQFPMEPLE